MSKRGPLSKIEKFYIEQKFSGTDIDELSKDLDRAKSVVEAYINKYERINKKTVTRISQQIPSSNGSTVMTENGSVLADSFKTNANRTGKTRPSCITSIR